MPAHNYTPIPLEDEVFSTTYNTGIPSTAPSTAPPSFHSVPLSSRRSFHLPHRNDESAATIMPAEAREGLERPRNRPPMPPSLAGDDPAISIWAPSTTASELGVDLEAAFPSAREDAIARLMERVEALERRIPEGSEGQENGRLEVESKSEREIAGEHWSRMDCCGVVGGVLFLIWICGTVTLAVAARYRAAGHKE